MFEDDAPSPMKSGVATARLLGFDSGADAKVESLATLDNPWAMAFLPDGRLLILRMYTDNKLSGAISGVPRVEYQEQGGLLDVVVDPDFACNQLVYLSC